MVYKVRLLNKIKKYLKKLKERELKEKFLNGIYKEIATHPYSFYSKIGDLAGIYAYPFTYKGTQYRIAYTINDKDEIIIIILTGSHEKFYEKLKRLINN